MLDNKLSLNVAHDAESVVSSMASVAPLSDLNTEIMGAKELAAKKLKKRVSEYDTLTAVGTVDDDGLTVDNENMQVECMKAADGSVVCTADLAQSNLFKYNSLNDGHSENMDDDMASGRCNTAAAVKLCNVPVQQRKTFTVQSADVSESTMPLQVQSDSLDVMNLIYEVVGIRQRSAELSAGNSDDISTQEIEAHEDQLDGLKQQHSAAGCTENAQCTVEAVSVPSTYSNGIDIAEQQAHVSQLSDSVLEPASHAVIAADGTTVDTGTGHHVPEQTLQSANVHALSLTPYNEAENLYVLLNSNTLLVPNDDSEQLCMPPSTVDVDTCSKSLTCAKVAHHGSVIAADDNIETEQSVSEEVSTSNVDSQSGESMTLIYTLHAAQ